MPKLFRRQERSQMSVASSVERRDPHFQFEKKIEALKRLYDSQNPKVNTGQIVRELEKLAAQLDNGETGEFHDQLTTLLGRLYPDDKAA